VSENFNEIETKSQQLTNRKRINCHLPVAWIESANINIQSKPTLVEYIYLDRGVRSSSFWPAYNNVPVSRVSLSTIPSSAAWQPGSLNSQRCSHSISACLPTAGSPLQKSKVECESRANNE